jgi:BirA family biotin operon repressor/biotin-[acetyl-CoA-carboxylase] ligase
MDSAHGHVDVPLLHALLSAEGAQTLGELAGQLHRDVWTVARQVAELRRAGCRITEHPQHGARLEEAGLPCWADYIEQRHRQAIGRRTLVYRQTGSTQDLARQLASGAADLRTMHGVLITTDHQTAGRGRLGRQWMTWPGMGVLATAIVDQQDQTADHLMLATCHAVAETVEQLSGLRALVRWPNDILIGSAKLAGILVESVGGAALVGVGLNVSGDREQLAARLAMPATSLAACGCIVDRLIVLDVLCAKLHEALYDTRDDVLATAWRQRSTLRQQRVTVDSGGTRLVGRVLDVDCEHGLLLQVEHGPVVTLPAASTSLVHEAC